MKTAKKGFTLIELMVVIVIIGVLAAIAIPKLFGMTARAKAAELGPAAGTWVKLQQGYWLENDIISGGGTYNEIGYTPPTSKVFDYDNSASTKGEWSAKLQKDGKSTVKLNECTGTGVLWKLEAKTVDCAEYSVTEGDGADADACKNLTKIQDIAGVEEECPDPD